VLLLLVIFLTSFDVTIPVAVFYATTPVASVYTTTSVARVYSRATPVSNILNEF
jgi:hypothetical protein